jgi:hypothetical protein
MLYYNLKTIYKLNITEEANRKTAVKETIKAASVPLFINSLEFNFPKILLNFNKAITF